MKKVFMVLLTILIISNSMTVSFAEMDKGPSLNAKAAVLINASTGEVLYNKNMNQKMYPASTTKIMTALLVLENLDLSSTVTIDKETAETGECQINLIEGEKVTVEQLLYALLLKSANDAAVALAKEVDGSIPAFADRMNARAKELGAQNTNFVTPNGLHDDNHYTTAYDLAMITKEAMKNKEFRKIVTTLKYTIPETNKSDARVLHNPNKLLYSKTKILVNGVLKPLKYEGATGIKNGYTSEAERCLVAGAKRENIELISVVLKTTATGKFADSIALLDYGFENYKSVPAIKKGDSFGKIKVIKGAVRNVEIVAAKSSYLTILQNKADLKVNKKVMIDNEVAAPVSKGQKVGKVEIYTGNILVDAVDVVTVKQVDKGGILSVIGIPDSFSHILKIALLVIIVLFAIFISRKKRN
ncbi:D-alanyl-D-alanine carboxypeptidase family protein [Aminipila sp.]|uniref:D-alanyl-D-alanine carboxypeptidase family protein n=1 Tax=Aminipila sp. TaxID=2060095 RepID=UPI00289F9F0A|nr:D-alanyl-D-alanine carboxypeptidase family protein [Aminipila sp.]